MTYNHDTWPECSVCNAFYLNAMELTIQKEGCE